MSDSSLDRLGESIDRLITVEFRPQVGSVPAGLVAPLYETARSHHGSPLTTSASQMLIERAAGKSLLIVTGAGISPALPAGETDGPPGAVALARSLAKGLNCEPILVTEANHAPAVEFALDAAGIGNLPVELFSMSSTAEAEANRLLDTYSPAAVVFVERDGRNANGRYHGVRGNCRPPGSVAAADELAIAARLRGTPTIGIGDGGNEVGFGLFREAVAKVFPDEAICHDGCPSGRVTTVSTDICVAAGVSNWGAYGVVAALSAMLNRTDLLIDPSLEQLLIEACLRGGARDGANGASSLSVDGVSAAGSQAILTLLHELITIYVS